MKTITAFRLYGGTYCQGYYEYDVRIKPEDLEQDDFSESEHIEIVFDDGSKIYVR